MYNDLEKQRTEDVAKPAPAAAPAEDEDTPSAPPWLLQLYFDGEINLDQELTRRYSSMPLMSVVHFRTFGQRARHGVATLATQDGAASALVEVDVETMAVQFTLTLSSMLSLSFQLHTLSDIDRSRWLDLMRSGDTELAFLWGQSRWEDDYLICAPHKYYTNIYAFSPRHIAGAFRMTPEVTNKLLDWLNGFWTSERSPRW